MMRVQVVWLGLIAFCSVTGCQSPAGPGAIGTGPVKIVATTSIIADAVKQVGGVHVDVKTLMPAGTDPHNYLPASGDSETLSQAHIVFFNGLHLGAIVAACIQHDLGANILTFMAAHGPVELSIICICSGSGLMIGQAMIDPGDSWCWITR